MSELDAMPFPPASIMVAVGINPHSQRLLQVAARLARGLGGSLLAVHIRPPGTQASLYYTNIEWHFEQARALGAATHVLEGNDVVAMLVQYAQAHGVTHVVVGQSDVSRWHEVRHGSIINRLLREVAQRHAAIDVYVVTGSSRL
jgi:two-component system sensor histidine kinase KdpD